MAQEASAKRTTFYVGGGMGPEGSSLTNGDMPFSVGVMHQLEGRKLVLGFDLAGEGTSLDSTWGKSNDPVQALSMNLLIGGNLADGGRVKTDAALIVGLRDTARYCAPSFLGFQCYADADPTQDYAINFGGVVTVSFDSIVVGLRATSESAQIVAGVRF